MVCVSCSSSNQAQFAAEIAIHSPGLKCTDTPHIFIYPNLLVCLDCGFTQFTLSEGQLGPLGERAAA